MKKIISSVALNALYEALSNIYWYKDDLHRFLDLTLPNVSFVSQLNWTENKRSVASALVQRMGRNQELFQSELLRLMEEVCNLTDFSHFNKLDGSEIKIKKAKNSVDALRLQMKGYIDLKEEKARQAERQEMSKAKILKIQGIAEKLENLKEGYHKLLNEKNSQKRGFALEKLLRELFELFDLDPKASFKIIGEQIDGAFTFNNIDFLLEAKWEKDSIGSKELYGFDGKLKSKLENTLGLYLSINGFSEDGVTAYSGSGRRLIILTDGADLMAVLDGRIKLDELLLRKRRHASQTGQIYLRIHEILS